MVLGVITSPAAGAGRFTEVFAEVYPEQGKKILILEAKMIDLIIVENGRVTDMLSNTPDKVSVSVIDLDTTKEVEQRAISENLENTLPEYKNIYILTK